MEQSLSYVVITPYTVARSRTGGVLSRLLSRADLEFVGAQMIGSDEDFASSYAQILLSQSDPKNPEAAKLLADYVINNFGPVNGRKQRSIILFFRGKDAYKKLSDICGALYPENMSVESLTGETIRDTYADLLYDSNNLKRVTYFEPAVFTPRSKESANNILKLLARWLPNQSNLIENISNRNKKGIERTLVIIKPENWRFASSKPGTIIDMFSRTGLKIVGIKLHRMSVGEALEFYGPVKESLQKKLAPTIGREAKETIEKQFEIIVNENTEQTLAKTVGCEYAFDQFEQIIEFMSGRKSNECPTEELNNPGSVKCLILVYEGFDACNKIREVLGPTDPSKAPEGTVRREFGRNIMINTAHASDSPENALREMGIVNFNHNDCATIIKEYLESNS